MMTLSSSTGAIESLSRKDLVNKLQSTLGELRIIKAENKQLHERVLGLHQQHLVQHLPIDQEEKFITNKLLHHISHLKKEKGDLLLEFEQEEEYLTNSLQRRLAELQREKIDLENALEQEQECMVNKLQAQFEKCLSQHQNGGFRPLMISTNPKSPRRPINHRRQTSSSSLNSLELSISPPLIPNSSNASLSNLSPPASMAPTDALRGALNALQFRYIQMERLHKRQLSELHEVNRRLTNDNFMLKQRLIHHSEKLGELTSEKEALIHVFENTSELSFNTVGPVSSQQRPLLRRTQSLRSELHPIITNLSPGGSLSPTFGHSGIASCCAAPNYYHILQSKQGDEDGKQAVDAASRADAPRARSLSSPSPLEVLEQE